MAMRKKELNQAALREFRFRTSVRLNAWMRFLRLAMGLYSGLSIFFYCSNNRQVALGNSASFCALLKLFASRYAYQPYREDQCFGLLSGPLLHPESSC